MRYIVGLYAIFIHTVVAAQMINYAVESVDYLGDMSVNIVDYLGDESWEVLGACSNTPNLKVNFVDYLGDISVNIVDYLGDKKICITNADQLDYDLLKKLNLTD